MPSETSLTLLDRAAAACGIGPGFWDIWGNYHETAPEVKREILRAHGIDATDDAALRRSLAGMMRREWDRLLPPSLVVSESDHLDLPLSVAADALGDPAEIDIRHEDGQVTTVTVNLHDLPQIESVEMDGRTWLRKRASLGLRLPLGYHDAVARVGSSSACCRIIVTPERAFIPESLARGNRAAGIAISLYGLRSARNWGCGDFTDLLSLIDWAAGELHAGFVGLNPLHAIHNRRPFNTSPYLPNCIFYQNFLYLDVEQVEDFARSRRARRCRENPATERELSELRASPFVEYERVAALKLRFLKLAFLEFLREWRQDTPRARAFRAFREAEGALLEKFALYCALDEYLHRHNPDLWTWRDWPNDYQDPDSGATREFQNRHWRSVLFYEYLQWQIENQLRPAQQRARERGMCIGLFHDLALATDRYGGDLWAHRPFFVNGCRVGSPPDDFSPQGQDWGFPPPDSERHREDGYRLFAESIRRNCRNGGALRIDHVMRLFRLYWIPDQQDARGGAYVTERNDDYVRVLALESVRNRVAVIGEDLGTVEPEVRETLARFGILSYRLFYFEKNGRGGFRLPHEYEPQALVSSTTHDLPTLAGFWTGADIEARRAAGVLDDEGYRAQHASRSEEKQKMLDALFEAGLLRTDLPRRAADYPVLTGELHHAAIGFLARTPSQLLAINQEDLTKEPAQQNLPGTTWQYPNWGRKMRYTLDELRDHPEARSYTAMVRNWIAETGRADRAG